MKKLVSEYTFSAEQLNKIADLASETGLTEQIVRILYARGVDAADKIGRFMHPSRKNFLSPFLMRGMEETVRMLTEARDEGKTVAVFGDYDADGICASAIMYHALREFGIEAHIYIPERADGYGLSMEAVDRIFEDCNPELFITVDCGISGAKEAQYIYELGSDVIVTDHHELPETLPDCVIVNPKLKDEYPYDNLCGAGVAFKVACALIGEKAYEYLDFAALATVADSVPLLGENRDIVTEGLKIFNTHIRSCFSSLVGKTYDGITAQTLAFTLAPRVNAAGRMGDARAAFRLFTSEDESEIYELSVKLCMYNTERQKYCDELYASAKKKLLEKGAYGNVIMLSDESWNTGFIGIVAARIAEEYNRPTLLFVHKGDMLKGSARSIESVNIFNALKNCGEYIEEFGGHAQAAGVNLRFENFDKLESALDKEIGSSYTAEDFEQNIYISEEITSPFPEKFARELVAMEPYGVGHRRPLFALSTGACVARPLKFGSPHLTVKSEYIDLEDHRKRRAEEDRVRNIRFPFQGQGIYQRACPRSFIRRQDGQEHGGEHFRKRRRAFVFPADGRFPRDGYDGGNESVHREKDGGVPLRTLPDRLRSAYPPFLRGACGVQLRSVLSLVEGSFQRSDRIARARRGPVGLSGYRLSRHPVRSQYRLDRRQAGIRQRRNLRV